jgi:hypothetical protein
MLGTQRQGWLELDSHEDGVYARLGSCNINVMLGKASC